MPPTKQGGAKQANGIKDCCSDQPNSDRALSWGIRDGTTCNDGDQKDKKPDETNPSRYCRAGAKQGADALGHRQLGDDQGLVIY